MNPVTSYKRRSQLIWGVLLIVGGVLFLFDRVDVFDLAQVWHYWPVILLLFGLNKMIPPTNSKRCLNGVWEIGFAIWFYLAFEELWGLTFFNSWPFLLIIGGACMVAEPLFNRYLTQRAEGGHEKP